MRRVDDILNSRKPKERDISKLRGLPIRNMSKPQKTSLDNEYFSRGYAAALPKATTLVYLVLAKHARHDTQICWPAYETIRDQSGVRSRQSISTALRLLERFGLLAIIHSKGRTSNKYALLHPNNWEEPNRSLIDTVKKQRNSTKKKSEPYHSESSNSIASDTRSPLRESTKEITGNSFKKEGANESPTDKAPALSDESLWQELSPAARAVLPEYYSREQILRAIRDVKSRGLNVDSKPLHEALKRLGIAPLRPLPGWFSKPKMV